MCQQEWWTPLADILLFLLLMLLQLVMSIWIYAQHCTVQFMPFIRDVWAHRFFPAFRSARGLLSDAAHLSTRSWTRLGVIVNSWWAQLQRHGAVRSIVSWYHDALVPVARKISQCLRSSSWKVSAAVQRSPRCRAVHGRCVACVAASLTALQQHTEGAVAAVRGESSRRSEQTNGSDDEPVLVVLLPVKATVRPGR